MGGFWGRNYVIILSAQKQRKKSKKYRITYLQCLERYYAYTIYKYSNYFIEILCMMI